MHPRLFGEMFAATLEIRPTRGNSHIVNRALGRASNVLGRTASSLRHCVLCAVRENGLDGRTITRPKNFVGSPPWDGVAKNNAARVQVHRRGMDARRAGLVENAFTRVNEIVVKVVVAQAKCRVELFVREN